MSLKSRNEGSNASQSHDWQYLPGRMRFLPGPTLPGGEGYLPTMGRQHRHLTQQARVQDIKKRWMTW